MGLIRNLTDSEHKHANHARIHCVSMLLWAEKKPLCLFILLCWLTQESKTLELSFADAKETIETANIHCMHSREMSARTAWQSKRAHEKEKKRCSGGNVIVVGSDAIAYRNVCEWMKAPASNAYASKIRKAPTILFGSDRFCARQRREMATSFISLSHSHSEILPFSFVYQVSPISS